MLITNGQADINALIMMTTNFDKTEGTCMI